MFTVSEIVKAVNGRLISGSLSERIRGVSIDSRTVKKGDIFIAIKGEQFDGHDFVEEALKKGAQGACISRIKSRYRLKMPRQKNIIVLVDDTLEALGALGHYHRMRFKSLAVIGITGSNGKTTTKELLAKAISARHKVLKSEASFNNEIGVPLTLLKIRPFHTACVIEMGMNHLGEITRLAKIARPGIGIITNIGPSHMGFLKNLDNVAQAKKELAMNLWQRKIAILNKDDRFLRSFNAPCSKIYYGITEKCNFRASEISFRGGAWSFLLNGKTLFRLPLLGRHNIYNALAAIACADSLGVNALVASANLSDFKSECLHRLDRLKLQGMDILDDTYNSNPQSMRCAIQALRDYKTNGRRVLVAGDMLELGARAKVFHSQIGAIIARSKIDKLITVGRLSRLTAIFAEKRGMPGGSIFMAGSCRGAISALKKITKRGDAVLVKGSRNMEMEKIIEGLR